MSATCSYNHVIKQILTGCCEDVQDSKLGSKANLSLFEQTREPVERFFLVLVVHPSHLFLHQVVLEEKDGESVNVRETVVRKCRGREKWKREDMKGGGE